MDTRKIKKLIELVKETGIGELEVKSGEESVRISTTVSQTAPVVPAQTSVVAPIPAAETSSAPPAEKPKKENTRRHFSLS